MVSKMKCGHPTDWILKLQYGGKRYTYCLGCLVERTGLRNLEAYENPLINLDKKEEPVVTFKETKTTTKK